MAKGLCPNCMALISRSANPCPKCGQPLTEELWEQAKARAARRDKILAIPLGICLVALLGWMMTPSSPGKKQAREERSCNDPVEAFVYSQFPIRERLKSPESAKFPYVREAEVTALGDCRHRVVAFVDAANSFGASIRTYYTIIMQYRAATESWLAEVPSLKISTDRKEVVRYAAAYTSSEPKGSSQALPSFPPVPPATQDKKQDGNSDDKVRVVQRYLAKRGYDVGTPDGLVGPRTLAAMEKYRVAEGMPPASAQVLLTRIHFDAALEEAKPETQSTNATGASVRYQVEFAFSACPSIEPWKTFADEMDRKNFQANLPSSCRLVRRGDTIVGPPLAKAAYNTRSYVQMRHGSPPTAVWIEEGNLKDLRPLP